MRVKRKFFAPGVVLASVVALSSCSGGANSAPDEVLTQYVEALNAREFSEALALVADADGVSADGLAKPDDVTLPEPKATETEVDDGAEAVSLEFRMGDESPTVDFVKDEGAWKLEQPLFVYEQKLSELGLFGLLVADGVEPEPVDGVDLFTADHVVLSGETEYPAEFDFPGNRFIDAVPVTTTVSYTEDDGGELSAVSDDAWQTDGDADVPISEDFFAEIEAASEKTGVDQPDDGRIDKAVTEFVTREDCKDVELERALLAGYEAKDLLDEYDQDGDLVVTCKGGAGTATAEADDLVMGPPGTVEKGEVIVRATVEDGELTVETHVSV